MAQVKTSELSGAALDWAVAKAEGYVNRGAVRVYKEGILIPSDAGSGLLYAPSTDWARGGPIIERERISVISDFHEIEEGWLAESYTDSIQQFGPTPLIAAMRCFVASKLGDVVEIPEELC